jgi:Na+-translocating ferredoxin:NAD+ oxidoreductase subunit B
MTALTPEQIDQLLPQTQCGLCGYGGCMPYAEAMVFEKAAINLCPPGGVKTMQALGGLLQQDASPYLADMAEKTKAKTLAYIREAECIGCMKCINVCPVDAILGSAKHMHTVIADECTGCDLCVPACPVDCIDLLNPASLLQDEKTKADHARKRFNAREQRLAQEKAVKKSLRLDDTVLNKRNYIQEAIERAKAKKRC